MSDASRATPGGRFSSFAEELGLLGARVVASRTGRPTLAGESSRLLSGHDPLKESERQAAGVAAERVVLVGLGLGYLAAALGSRLATLVRASGEQERLASAHDRDHPEYAASFSDLVIENWDELARAIRDAVLRGETLVLDPSWAVSPDVVARVREIEASARWGAAPYGGVALRDGSASRSGVGGPGARPATGVGLAERVPGCDEERIEAAGRRLDSATVAAVLESQWRHNFHAHPPFVFEPASPPDAKNPPRRILCVQPSSIGDVLYFTPALAALRARYPEASLGLVVDDDAVSAVLGGDVDLLFVARRSSWCSGDALASAGVKRFLAVLASWAPDLVINPHATARAAWYATVAAKRGRREEPAPVIGIAFRSEGAPVLRGTLHHARWLTEMGSALTLAPIPSPVLPPPGARPPWLVAAELARRSGVSLESVAPRLDPGHGALTAAAVFRASSRSPERLFIAVHTGSRAAERRYRRALWPRVIEGLVGLDHDVVLVGGPADVERHEWIRERLSPAILDQVTDATARGDLKFTAALLSGAAMLVGPETSTVHLASAVGVPALTITGRVLSGWSGAVSARSLVVHGPADPPWCGLLPPELVVDLAAFVLGRVPMPALPAGFESAGTGRDGAGEFERAATPWQELPESVAQETVLGLAWAVFVGTLNELSGWRETVPDALQVRARRGPLPSALSSELRRLLDLAPEDPWWRRFCAVPFGDMEDLATAQGAARRFLGGLLPE